LEKIAVNGLGSTGSSAVVDLLKEYSDTFIVPGEFRFLQDPDGLIDFCFNIDENWGWVRSDAFVRRFIKYTDIIGRKPKYWETGERLDEYFNGEFFNARDRFLKQVVDTEWNGYWFYHDYHESGAMRTFVEKCKRYLRN